VNTGIVPGQLYGRVPIPLGAMMVLFQASLGIVLFAVFQEYVPVRLGSGNAWGGYLLAAYGLARFVSETPTGMLTDRVERKLALLLGLLVATPAIVASAFLENTWAFLGFAVALGVGTAFLWPAAYAICADLYPMARRGKVIGFLNLCQLAGFGMGALSGALLVEREPGVLFAIASATATGAIVLALFTVPSYRGTGGMWRRVQAEARPSLRSIWSLKLAALSGLVLLSTSSVALVVPAIRPYGTDILQVQFSTLTLALAPAVLVGAMLYVPAGHLADKAGRMVPFLLGQALLIAGMVTVAQTTLLEVAAFGGALIFAGNVFAVPAFNAAVMDMAPETHRGTLIGLTVALSGLGLAMGPAAGGAILHAWGPDAAFRVAAAIAVVTAVAILAYRRAFASPSAAGRFAGEAEPGG
jgi:MFS family permease